MSGGSYKKCYPFEYNQDITNYKYKNNTSSSKYPIASHSNIAFVSQDIVKGKTFEYDLILHNPALDLLITDSMSNKEEIKELMLFYENKNPILDYERKLRGSDENKKIIDSMKKNTSFTADEKFRAIIAARYLNSVGKGENALELACALEENLNKKGTSEYKEFIVPDYIKRAIVWICQ